MHRPAVLLRHGSCSAHACKMARHENVYDAMLAGFMKLLLVICIGALTLSKFAGFEWCVAAAADAAAAAAAAWKTVTAYG
eukprot:COSAG02_NODE_2203_length_9520_cov_14.356013_15_plen_80_part_00